MTTLVGQLLYLARRYGEACETLAHVARFAPSYAPARFYEASALVMQGESDRALAVLDAIHGRDMAVRVQALRGAIAARRGDRAGARRALARIDAGPYPSRLSYAAVLLALDESEAAAAMIAAAADRGEPMRFLARIDPLYARLNARA